VVENKPVPIYWGRMISFPGSVEFPFKNICK